MGAHRRKKRGGRTLASRADKNALYQSCVQEPEADVRFFDRIFRKEYGRAPLSLREDFCSTAAVCCAWVQSRRDRTAIGIDIDPKPLAWARKNNLSVLPADVRKRMTLIRDDVREAKCKKADIIAAENFGYFVFKTRDDLRGYFTTAKRHLNNQGILVLDIIGGSVCQIEEREEKRREHGLTYVWEERRFDPITHDCLFRIHFRFRDGSELRNAFEYRWRLWSIPEVRELLKEAGFRRSDVYWEGTYQKTWSGNGVYTRREHAESDPSWIAYIIGVV